MTRSWVLLGLLACHAAIQPAHSMQSKQEAQVRALLARPPADLAPLIKISGDDMDTRITVSTHGVTAPVSRGLIASRSIENSFLRAYIDKKTGTVSAHIYHIASYGGRGWHFYRRATVETPDGVKEVEAMRIASDVSCYRGGCTHYEDIGIPVDFAVFEAAAASYSPYNPIAGLRYRLFGDSGDRIDEGVPVNEIVAFVDAIKRVQLRLK